MVSMSLLSGTIFIVLLLIILAAVFKQTTMIKILGAILSVPFILLALTGLLFILLFSKISKRNRVVAGDLEDDDDLFYCVADKKKDD